MGHMIVLYITVFYLTRENVNKMISGVLTLHVVFTVYDFAIRLSHARRGVFTIPYSFIRFWQFHL